MIDKLTHANIEKLFSPTIYESGLRIYHADLVNGLSFNKNSGAWFAEVEDKVDKYYAEVDMSKMGDGTIQPYCECPHFSVHHTCAHIVAVLLEISDRQKRQTTYTNPYAAEQFIEALTNLELIDGVHRLDKIPMQVQYELFIDSDQKVWLQLKTGIERLYVVHHIRDFMEAILQNKEHYFTKKFTYRPEDYYFLQKDMEIFQLIQSSLYTGDLYTDRLYEANNAYDRKQILISPTLLRPLLEKLQDRETIISDSYHAEAFQTLYIKDDLLPTHIDIAPLKDSYELHVNGMEHTIYLPLYQALYKEGTFYFMNTLQERFMDQLLKLGKENIHIPIAVGQRDLFFSETLPKIRKITNVTMDESVEEQVVEAPLVAKFYLEMNEDKILGNLQYCYGAYTIDPFKRQHYKNKIIVRDMEKEEQIMDLIEQSTFKYNGKQLFIKLNEDEDIYEFLYTILPQLDEYVDVYLTDEIQAMMADVEPTANSVIKVNEMTNLLEINFDISNVAEEEVASMLQAVMEKKRFYRLKNGAVISLETASFQSIQQLATSLNIDEKQLDGKKIELPAYYSMQVDELLDLKKKYDPSFRKLLQQLQAPEQMNFTLPEDLHADLRPYQEVGYQWFKSLSEYQLGGILADDMGLGKTIQTIAYLLSEKSNVPHLVVVPSSVVYNWENECRKFAPQMDVVVIAGNKARREELLSSRQDADVWIMSYGTARQDINQLKDLTFHSFILDEAQFIKNYVTKTAKAMREINARNCFALSGTPIENSVDELWSILHVVLPGFMPNIQNFRQLPHEKIASLIQPFMLRRVKEDVLKELPNKIELTSISELTNEQKQLYVGYLQQLQRETNEAIDAGQFQQQRMKILAGITRLRQLCCHPSLFLDNYDGKSGKLDQLMEMVERNIQQGKRMLIFSQFTSMHDIIINELKKRNIDYFYIHGETPAKKRVEMSNAFNNGNKDVFLISLRAGGTGLNLTGADTVILYDLWWNPAVEDQAAGRAHRFGQKNVVQVIRMIAEGTIEEKIYALQQEKRTLMDQIIKPGETLISSLSENDIKELLSL